MLAAAGRSSRTFLHVIAAALSLLPVHAAAEHAMNQLFRRCVECPPDTPTCPQCAANEACSLRPPTCDNCAYMQCVPVATLAGQQQTTAPNGPPIGGIVGGVLGGLLFLGIISFSIWWFILRDKRKGRDTWDPTAKELTGQPTQRRPRANSIASTVLTRASNVIQIAYIPGVTNRSAPDTPDVHVPSTYEASTVASSPQVEQHFFMPLRDSTYTTSDTTSIASGDNRFSIAPSLARASMAETLYTHDVEVPAIPVQYYQRHANVVSVKSGSSTPAMSAANSFSPPPPQSQPVNASQIVARNVTARPVQIKKRNSTNSSVPTLANLATSSNQIRRKPNVPSFSDEKEVVFGESVRSPALTVIEDSPSTPQQHLRTPYAPSADGGSTSGVSALASGHSPLALSSTAAHDTGAHGVDDAFLNDMIRHAVMNASQDSPYMSSSAQSNQRPELFKHDSGPFADSNEIRDNRGL